MRAVPIDSFPRVLQRAGTIVLAAFLFSAVLVGPAPHDARAVDQTPAGGSWNWCATPDSIGCIKQVVATDPSDNSTTYTTSSALPSDLRLTVNCGVDAGRNCQSRKFEQTTGGPCRERAEWGGYIGMANILIDVEWAGHTGWKISVDLSMGDFRPAFLIGHGTTATRTTDRGDGTYDYGIDFLIQTVYSASPPSNFGPNHLAMLEWLKTAEATTAKDAVHVQLWPKDHLINSSRSSTGCAHYPFEGSWAEANAQGFSWSYSSTAGADFSAPNVLKFTASAPHYLPRSVADPLQVMPARVQIFLPTSYFIGLGYASLDELDTSIFSVTTEDGQSVAPTLTKRSNGVVINLGVQHYSAPNPTLTFRTKGGAPSSTSPTASLPSRFSATSSVKGSKAVFTLNTPTAATYRIYRKVGTRLVLVKTVRARAGSTTVSITHKKGASYVVRNSGNKTLKTLRPR